MAHNSEISIAIATDDGFVHHSAVVVASLLSNTRHPSRVRLYVLSQRLSDENFGRLEGMVKGYGATAVQCALSSLPADLPVGGHITIESYFRLALGEVIPAAQSRVLYLDSDLVVLGDVETLWNWNLDGRTVGVVEDPVLIGRTVPTVPPDHVYFNAGVLLIDLTRWRAHGVRERALAYAREHEATLQFHDQDVLNGLFSTDATFLPPVWNVQNVQKALVQGMATRYQTASVQEVILATLAPAILHFTGVIKPWHFASEHPGRVWYFRYLATTPWAGREPADMTFYKRFRKRMRPLKHLGSRAIDGM